MKPKPSHSEHAANTTEAASGAPEASKESNEIKPKPLEMPVSGSRMTCRHRCIGGEQMSMQLMR